MSATRRARDDHGKELKSAILRARVKSHSIYFFLFVMAVKIVVRTKIKIFN